MTKEEAMAYGRRVIDLGLNDETQVFCELAIEALEQQPHSWIPVSERLPEEDTAVLVWCPERKNTYCAYLEEGQWWIFGAHFQKVALEVVAWMPSPEPYKAESEISNDRTGKRHEET